MSEPELVYLISGANRGLGLGLVKEILKSPNTVVFAGARDPSRATDLQALVAKHPGRLFVVKLISADETTNKAVAEEIRKKYGRVDTVIANAGILRNVFPVADLPLDGLREHYEVNVIGPTMLFQTTQSLLRASKNPKFIPITSIGGSTTVAANSQKLVCYGSSKAALNWVARTISHENEWLVCFPFCPGGVLTDMMDDAIQVDNTGFFQKIAEERSLSPEQSAEIVITKILNATREKDSGKYYHVDSAKAEVIELAW